MSEGYRKMFWGIFIATFNINFGAIKILPAFIGFMVLSNGLNLVIGVTDSESFKKAKSFSDFIALILFIGGLLPLSGINLEPNIFFQFIPIIYLTIEILLFNKIFEGSIEKFNLDNYIELVDEYIGKLRFYIITLVLVAIIICFGITINLQGLSMFAGIVVIIVRIFLMSEMSKLKNLYAEIDENPEAN